MQDASTQGAPGNIRLTIRTLRPSSHELTVPAELLVGELKDRLVELTGVLRERQRLLFAGHALQDDQRLRERGVRDGHTIHLVERPEGAMGGPPPPTQGGGMPGQHAPASAGGMGTQMNWLSQLLGGLAGMSQQGATLHGAAQGIPPVGITVGNVPGFGLAAGGQQPAAAAAQQPQQPAMALLSLVQHFITHLSSQPPAAAQPPPATVPYVLPEGRRQDSERRWFTAAQAVLQDAELRPPVRRFVETSAAASMTAATAGTGAGAGRQQASQDRDARLPTAVAVAVGELLRQTGDLWRGPAADVLLTANRALSQLDQPVRPGQASDVITQLQLANAQLFAVGALAWELSRVCSMLVPALSGSAALPLATGRSAFINASGTAPITPMRVQPGLAGHSLLGYEAPSQQPPQGGTPVTVQLPNGALATGYFTGDAPSEAEFLQQLQYILGGQFGLPRPGEGPPQSAPAAGAASTAAGTGPTGHTGRRRAAAGPGQSQPSGSHAGAVDTEMPDLVADSGSSEYESEWEEADEGDEDTAAQASHADEPQAREQGHPRSDRGGVHPNPSVTITFRDQVGTGGRWPFLGGGAGGMPGPAPGAGSGASAGANAWETLLTNPRLGAVQQELGRLVCAVVMPILSELLSQPQAGGNSEAGTADFVEDLSERISSALQPSLAAIHSMVQAVAPVLQRHASSNAPAASRTQAQSSQAQRRAAAPRPSAQPAPATTAAEGMADAPADVPSIADGDSGEQQWAYIPTTTVSAEITVEPVDAAGQPMDTGDAAVGAPTSASQTDSMMAALSASLPAIQQAVLDAMTPQQPASVPSSDHPAAASPAAAGAGVSAGGAAVTGAQGSAELLAAGRRAADTPASVADEGPAGLGSSARPSPTPSHSSEARATAPSGIGGGLGLPPRPAPARRGPSASRRGRTAGPSATAATGAQAEPGAAGPQAGQLGTMLASMLGGAGSSMASGGGGGNLAQMLGQIASSPAMQQLATSPALQNAVQPLLSGGNSQSGRQAAGQIDFGSLMNEMGPVLAQLMGNSGGNQPVASRADTVAPPAPAAAAVQDVTERTRSTPLPDDAMQSLVDPAVEQTIRTELPAEQAQRWLDALRSDGQVMRDIERRPLSSGYRAGSAHPSSS